MSRTLAPQLSFADLELSRLGVHLDLTSFCRETGENDAG